MTDTTHTGLRAEIEELQNYETQSLDYNRGVGDALFVLEWRMSATTEAIAEMLWHRFSPSNETEWPSTHASEYRLTARDVLALLDTPPAPQETAGECPACQGSFFGCWKCTYGKAHPAAATTDNTALILEIIEWCHKQKGVYPDWFDRARKAVGFFDGDAGKSADNTALVEVLRPFVRLIEVSALRSCAEDTPIFTQGPDDDRRSITVGDFLRAETALTSRPAEANSREQALEKALRDLLPEAINDRYLTQSFAVEQAERLITPKASDSVVKHDAGEAG